MTDRRSFKRLSAAEALSALYIDFEGRKDEPPVFLGVHRRGDHVQPDIVDDAFATMGESSMSLHASVEKVVRRAEKRDVRIVSWSEHDLNVVRTLGDEDPDLVSRFEARYANARLVARRWRYWVHGGDQPDTGRLVDYLELIDYEVPDDAGPGNVGNTIRDIRDRLQRSLEPTPGQRDRWDRLVEHNWHDCVGMRQICIVATRELEAAL